MSAPKALLGLAALAAFPLGGCADTLAVLDEMLVGVAEGYAAGGYQSSPGGCYTDAYGNRSAGCYDYVVAPVNGQPFVPPAQPSSAASSGSSTTQGQEGCYYTNGCLKPTWTGNPEANGPANTGPRQTTPQ